MCNLKPWSFIWLTSFVLFGARIVSANYAVCTADQNCIRVEKCGIINRHFKEKRTEPKALKLQSLLRRRTCGYDGENVKVCCPIKYCQINGKEGTCKEKSDCPERNLYEYENYQCDPGSVCCPKTCVATDLPSRRGECCGLGTPIYRISNGDNADIHQYPWTVLIRYKDPKMMCGGSLISGRYVLTAAHCALGRIDHVVVGEYDIEHSGPDCVYYDGYKDCTEGERRIKVTEVFPHEDYSLKRHEKNDIALLRLAEMATFTDFVQPVCLPSGNSKTKRMKNTKMFVMGWGAVNNTHERSNLKQVASVFYMNNNKCKKELGVNLRKTICAIGKHRQGACQGDSGGPLVQYSDLKKLFELRGIHIFGTALCGMDKPGVYTNVADYLDWIEETIQKEEYYRKQMSRFEYTFV